jgi:hypothetical protein
MRGNYHAERLWAKPRIFGQMTVIGQSSAAHITFFKSVSRPSSEDHRLKHKVAPSSEEEAEGSTECNWGSDGEVAFRGWGAPNAQILNSAVPKHLKGVKEWMVFFAHREIAPKHPAGVAFLPVF